jgi:ABC-type phosphate transport system substrate-binding protein
MVALTLSLALDVTPALAQIAVIVNRSNPVNDLTRADLEALYLGQRTSFANGAPAVLGEYRPARRSFYRSVLHLSESAVSRHWIGIVFSEGQATPPRSFRDGETAHRFVLSTPGAICFIDLEAVTDDVKVVTVGGLRPRDPAYPLR